MLLPLPWTKTRILLSSDPNMFSTEHLYTPSSLFLTFVTNKMADPSPVAKTVGEPSYNIHIEKIITSDLDSNLEKDGVMKNENDYNYRYFNWFAPILFITFVNIQTLLFPLLLSGSFGLMSYICHHKARRLA